MKRSPRYTVECKKQVYQMRGSMIPLLWEKQTQTHKAVLYIFHKPIYLPIHVPLSQCIEKDQKDRLKTDNSCHFLMSVRR